MAISDIRINVGLIEHDMVARGWNQLDLASNTKCSRPTINRLLKHGLFTPRTLAQVAIALGRSPRDYMVTEAA